MLQECAYSCLSAELQRPEEFIFGFQFNDMVSGIRPVGYVYIINTSPTATANVTITTPLITTEPHKVDISLSVNPRDSAYVTIPSDTLMDEVSGIQPKGKMYSRRACGLLCMLCLICQ